MVISMLTTKTGKCRFASIIRQNPAQSISEFARELNVNTTVIKRLRDVI